MNPDGAVHLWRWRRVRPGRYSLGERPARYRRWAIRSPTPLRDSSPPPPSRTARRWRRPSHRRGDHFDEVNIRREAYNFYFQDTWKVMPRFALTYGLRYEVNSRIHEGERRTSTFLTVGANGKSVPVWESGAAADYASQSAAALCARPARVGAASRGGVAGHEPHGAARGRRNHDHPPQPLV